MVEGLFGQYIIDRCAITGVYVLVFPWALFKLFYPGENKKLDRVIGFLCVIAFFLIIIFTDSRAGFIAFLVSMAILFLSLRKKLRFLTISFCAILLILSLLPQSYLDRMSTISDGVNFAKSEDRKEEEIKDKSSASRVIMWGIAFDIFKDNPLLGVGNLNFVKVSFETRFRYANKIGQEMFSYIYSPTASLAAHNMYLNILAEGGLLTALFFYAVLLLPLWRTRYVLTIMRGKEHTGTEHLKHFLIFLRAGYIGWLVTAFFSNALMIEYAYWVMTLIIILTYKFEQIIQEECNSNRQIGKVA